LSVFECWVFRHLGFPLIARALGHRAAGGLFSREGQRILYLAQDLTEEDLERRVLVSRPLGIEESACNWSVEMLMEHLILVGVHIREAVRQLGNGVRPLRKFQRSEFEPRGGRGLRTREEYGRFIERFTALYETHCNIPSRPTHRHPYFGELDAGHWLKLAAVLYKLHRNHAERILAGL